MWRACVRACVHALACACACHPVCVCVKQEMEHVSGGKIQQDIKGAERFSREREEKGNSEGASVLKVLVVEEGRGGGLADYPLHLAQLCRPTHTSKWYPYMPEA